MRTSPHDGLLLVGFVYRVVYETRKHRAQRT